MTRAFLLICVAFVSFAGCSGSSPEAEEETSGGEEEDGWGDEEWDEEPEVESSMNAIETIGISGPDKPWGEMTQEEQEWYMIGKVLPIMKEVFARHNEERWSPSEYECETCHGENMQEVAYQMPPQSGYRVPRPNTPAWTAMERIFPEVVTFMKDTVTPTMGTLLGEENYSCFDCHPSAE